MRCIVIFACVVVAVLAEHCRDNGDCDPMNCSTGTMPHCVHHVCTCDAAPTNLANCTTRDDCVNVFVHCPAGNEHCVDNVCHCRMM